MEVVNKVVKYYFSCIFLCAIFYLSHSVSYTILRQLCYNMIKPKNIRIGNKSFGTLPITSAICLTIIFRSFWTFFFFIILLLGMHLMLKEPHYQNYIKTLFVIPSNVLVLKLICSSNNVSLFLIVIPKFICVYIFFSFIV